MLYLQPNPSGTWGQVTNKTVKSLSNYKYIIVSSYDGNNNLILNPIFLPISIFKTSQYVCSAYIANQYAGSCYYVNDTTIGVSTIGYGIAVYGIK